MALGILKGYLKRPLWFLLSTVFTLPRFKKQLPAGLPSDLVQLTALQTWLYQRLRERIGQEKAYEVVRACVLPIGLAVQQGNLRTVEAPRTFENLIAFQRAQTAKGPPGGTRWRCWRRAIAGMRFV
jgi:hypothetical protein